MDVRWNVVGAGFNAVSEMLDPQVDEVREMANALAEPIVTLGGTPVALGYAGIKISRIGRNAFVTMSCDDAPSGWINGGRS